jgi:hypothetical protein
MNHMIVLFEEISHSRNKNSNHINSSKDDIFNVTKAVVRKSILMKIAKVKAANTSR